MSDTIEQFLEVPKCKCCRRPLRANSQLGYCKRTVCRKHAYANDADYRSARLAKNNRWHGKKFKEDPEWADRRRKANAERMRARRAAAKLRAALPLE